MDKIELITGDALEELKKLPSNAADLIVADPPYNLSKNYKATHDSMEFNEFLNFSRRWLVAADRVLRPGGTIYVFMGMRMISYMYSIFETEMNYTFQNWITWHYTQGLGKKRGFSSRHDDILVFSKKGGKVVFNLDAIRIPQKYYRSINNMRGANPGNVWDFSHIHYSQSDRMKHPTQKPEGIIERMVLASSNENDIVVDPFSGSGTTLRVCQQLNRKVIGIELEPSFVMETKERLSKPFYGFDSIDERMLRVPNDLNDPKIREEYFSNHINWFLHNHEASIEKFINAFISKYHQKISEEEYRYIDMVAKSHGVSNKKIGLKGKQISLFS